MDDSCQFPAIAAILFRSVITGVAGYPDRAIRVR
jgi:hypothetical protein